MSTYEAISLMIMFALLIISLLSLIMGFVETIIKSKK